MHQAISNVRTNKKEKGSAESSRARVIWWMRDNLEARMPLNNEKEKNQELSEEDRTWVRGRLAESRQVFIAWLEDERHEDDEDHIGVPQAPK
jgi:hypothetical protein